MARPPKEELRRDTRELKEALEHVGVLMQLPPKRPTAEMPAPKAPSTREQPAASSAGGADDRPTSGWRPNRAARFLPALAVLVAIVAVVVWSIPESTVALPDAAVGRWETRHPQYRSGSLAFTKSAVLLKANAESPEVTHEIVRVKTVRLGDSTHVIVTYKDGDGELDLEFALLGRERPKISFARPAGLSWERIAGGS